MAGIEAGKTWSRIGAEVAPTDSAASGVWGDLNEVAENIGAGTWPAPPPPSQYEYIASTTFDGSTSSHTFSAIPQTFNSLKIVLNVKSSSDTFVPSIQVNGDTSSNYYSVSMFSYGGTFYESENLAGSSIKGGFAVPAANTAMIAEATFANYSNTSIVSPVQLQWGCCSGTDQPSTFTQGVLRNSTAAITSITMLGDYGASYPLASGSTLALFGYKDA